MYNWSIMGLSDLVIGQSVFDLSVQIFCSDSSQRHFFCLCAGGNSVAAVAAGSEDDTVRPWWLYLTAVFIFRKSTFFNVLTKSQAAAENFPFCTIDPNESRVPIPDQRYDFLCRFHKPARYGGHAVHQLLARQLREPGRSSCCCCLKRCNNVVDM